jgi:predicted nucleic acid-binding protein
VAKLFSSYPPETELISSVLTLMECAVKPRRDGDARILARLEEFWRSGLAWHVPIDEEIARRATLLRARYEFLRAIDALQLACALSAGCTSFVTNDKKLKQVSELPILCLLDLAGAL